MRVALDVDVDELAALPGGAEHLIGDPFGVELLGGLRTVDGDDRLRLGELVHLVHAQQAHTDRDDGDQRHPDSRQDSPPD